MRAITFLLLSLLLSGLHAQSSEDLPATALSISHTTSIPLNKVQLYDLTLDALKATFGREPGANILLDDRGAGIIEAKARVNFRSAMLTGREETMGTIAYAIHVQVNAGELRMVVSGVTHTGNRNTRLGGISVGQLMRVDSDAPPTRGMGRNNVVRLHSELRILATTRINSLLRSLESHVRAHLEP